MNHKGNIWIEAPKIWRKRFTEYIGESYFPNFNWKVSFNCPIPPFRIGRVDGGKVVCDHLALKQDDCLVYSIGSRGDYNFEVICFHKNNFLVKNEVLTINRQCEVHTIEFGTDLTYLEWEKAHRSHWKVNQIPAKNTHFHFVGLKGVDVEEDSLKNLTIGSMSRYKDHRMQNGARKYEDIVWKTLSEIVKENGHEGREISLLKLDCGTFGD